ncbi:cysteine desulfurase [bacterium (Candidatus Gribaldobacteria) CG10_big_fil_rev_8_21_14_0_10_41_12]|uniref:Cysteine desulfurase n=1 Tax=bacterium (Candidatus Gribaldobacteria) CG10_big_fil_rev_8_21_14_0_10_41_12 TaxID=2014277 RepID=A0A2H0UWB9_9BACT|nr:MAG: cysteine desulfurase [Parcubacteria group bacterium CG1_02_41_26]PIR91107.1 MAG: cysteine desulfurase [bacterium (Candidatus Gribaldobacteria) CG10_big_fil_rev_8_21_14_0_10_41_12]
MIETQKIRKFFPAIKSGRIVSNNAASTQVPIQLLDLLKKLIAQYDNVHRGQSQASMLTTEKFEASYDTIAQFINAPSRKNIILYRNATEAINSVMYSLMTEFRDGDNVVTTFMEHNSNYVPWYGLCKEILPKFEINVECRIAKFNKENGELDLVHLKSLVDKKTKLICCVGASNFLGTKNPIEKIREIAYSSGYVQPNGEKKSYLLIDGAQLVPNIFIDVQELDIDFLVWSFHKMLAPFGVGALYAREKLLKEMMPFLYGGDMIAEGKVSPEKVEYNALPWKFTAGTPNILGTILSAQAIRLLIDFSLNPGKYKYFMTDKKLERLDVKKAMNNIEDHEKELIGEALKILGEIPSIKIYGPKNPENRAALVAFTCGDKSPFDIAEGLNKLGVESRAGCHCATLAHYYYQLNPPASCRLSFYIYNDLQDVRKACLAVKKCVHCK